MRSTGKIVILVFTFLAVAASAHAQSPREQLNEMVKQLQKNPGDNTLREKIIKFAKSIKPSPAIPDEAVRYTGRAMFVFKTAKSEADYLDAAREYELAVASAPWMVSYYADLCTIYEKARHYAEAKRACDFALIGTTDSSQAIELKQRIAGLEIGIERNSAAAQASRKQQEEFATFLKSIEGAVFQTNRYGWDHKITVVSGMLRFTWINHKDNLRQTPRSFKPTGFVTDSCGSGIEEWEQKVNCSNHVALSPDGKTITVKWVDPWGEVIHRVYQRVN